MSIDIVLFICHNELVLTESGIGGGMFPGKACTQ